MSSSIFSAFVRIRVTWSRWMIFSLRKLSMRTRTFPFSEAISLAFIVSASHRFLMMSSCLSSRFRIESAVVAPHESVAVSTSSCIWRRSASRSCSSSCSIWIART